MELWAGIVIVVYLTWILAQAGTFGLIFGWTVFLLFVSECIWNIIKSFIESHKLKKELK